MIVIDSSAIVAILKEEIEEEFFRTILRRAGAGFISSATHTELGIVISRHINIRAVEKVDALLDSFKINIRPLSATQSRLAIHAYHQYGRGSGHKAALNFGDCFAYALAKDTRLPLLFKGDDFTHTDIKNAAQVFAD